MDMLLTLELDESIVEQLDLTAGRLGKTRAEITNAVVNHILEYFIAENKGKECCLGMGINLFDKIKKDVS